MLALEGAFFQVLNILREAINRVLGAADFILYLIGIRLFKKLRLRVVVLRAADGTPLASEAAVATAVQEAGRVFAQAAKVRLEPVDPMVVIPEAVAPDAALNVHCDDGAYGEDFGAAGDYFRQYIARTMPGMLIGYGAPVTVFIVSKISGKGGCSLGPLTDYVTQEARTLGPNRLMAHEVAHACGLWHTEDKENLMYPRRPGTKLTLWQAAVLRNSRHVTYL